MRRFLLIPVLLLALAAPAAALAVSRSSGDGTFSIRNANGTYVITGKGAVIGQLDKGWVRIVDPSSTDGSGPIVSGAEHARPISDTTSLYSGTDVTFRMIGGTFTIRVSGQGIDFSFVGRGKVTLSVVDSVASADGRMSTDGGDTFRPLPAGSTTYTVSS